MRVVSLHARTGRAAARAEAAQVPSGRVGSRPFANIASKLRGSRLARATAPLAAFQTAWPTSEDWVMRQALVRSAGRFMPHVLAVVVPVRAKWLVVCTGVGADGIGDHTIVVAVDSLQRAVAAADTFVDACCDGYADGLAGTAKPRRRASGWRGGSGGGSAAKAARSRR